MRELKQHELDLVREKLYKFIGDNVKLLLERQDAEYCFRLNRDRVYYLSVSLLKFAQHAARKELISMGTCVGKFTKTKKFHLKVTFLDFLSPYAKHKIWLKPSAEQQFLYGNHVLKVGLGRMTENIDRNQGVVVFSMNDTPLGFGVAAKSTLQCKTSDPNSIVCYNQADIGEYLRNESAIC